ncbi:hypothetical protein [Paenibacillus allorhizoplanae]|nr:hypothetical protein [Paenibacillus allorhizoplanae]
MFVILVRHLASTWLAEKEISTLDDTKSSVYNVSLKEKIDTTTT